MIAHVELQAVQLRSGRVLQNKTPVIVEEEDEEIPANIAFDDELPTSQEHKAIHREQPILP